MEWYAPASTHLKHPPANVASSQFAPFTVAFKLGSARSCDNARPSALKTLTAARATIIMTPLFSITVHPSFHDSLSAHRSRTTTHVL